MRTVVHGPKPRRVTIVRYYDPDDKLCRKDTPGAKPVRTQSKTFYAWLKINGKYGPVSLKTEDIGQAWVELRKLQRREADRRAGIVDDLQEHLCRPIEQHIEPWLQSVRDNGAGEKRVALLEGRLRHLIDLTGWEKLAKVTKASALSALARLQTQEGKSAQTRNHYFSTLRQFFNWCADDHRLSRNPIRGIKPVSVEADRRHDRRVPTDEEITKLFQHLETAPKRSRMTGPQRALGYRVAMATGLRANELRSLTRESFDLEAGTVSVAACYSKHRRHDVQHLPEWLVKELREWFDAGGGLWDKFPENFPGRILKADLERCGIPYQIQGPNGPLFFDFHSLRHWYCTQVANTPGISPKTLMALTRHSTATLALKIYAKAQQQEIRAVVGQIQKPGERSA